MIIQFIQVIGDMALLKLKNNIIERFDAYNTDMVGIQQNNNFVVITGFAEDSKNNIWILNLKLQIKNLYIC